MVVLDKSNRSPQAESIVFGNSVEETQLQLSSDPQDQAQVIKLLTKLSGEPISYAARETISNAIDATIHLPYEERMVEINVNTYDKEFSVRDNGIGMTAEEIKKYIFQYGSSSKKTDFTKIGAKGLGAKAPLAYTNQFFVKSIKDGELTVARVRIGDDGYKGAILKNTETDLPNGTEISIPIKSNNDVYSFQSVAEKYSLNALETKIKVNGQEFENKSYDFVKELNVGEHPETHEPVMAKLWFNREIALTSNSFNAIGFLVGGWLYLDNQVNRYSQYSKEPFLILQTPPGVLEFESSRDSFIRDERYEEVFGLITDYVASDEFFNTLLDSFDFTDNKPLEIIDKIKELESSYFYSVTRNYSYSNSRRYSADLSKELEKRIKKTSEEFLSRDPSLFKLYKDRIHVLEKGEKTLGWYWYDCREGKSRDTEKVVLREDKESGPYLETFYFKFSHRQFTESNEDVYAVTGITVDNFKSVGTNQKAFCDSVIRASGTDRKNVGLLYYPEGSTITPEAKNVLKQNHSVVEISLGDLIEAAKKERSTRRKEAAEKAKSEHQETLIGVGLLSVYRSEDVTFETRAKAFDLNSLDYLIASSRSQGIGDLTNALLDQLEEDNPDELKRDLNIGLINSINLKELKSLKNREDRLYFSPSASEIGTSKAWDEVCKNADKKKKITPTSMRASEVRKMSDKEILKSIADESSYGSVELADRFRKLQKKLSVYGDKILERFADKSAIEFFENYKYSYPNGNRISISRSNYVRENKRDLLVSAGLIIEASNPYKSSSIRNALDSIKLIENTAKESGLTVNLDFEEKKNLIERSLEEARKEIIEMLNLN